MTRRPSRRRESLRSFRMDKDDEEDDEDEEAEDDNDEDEVRGAGLGGHEAFLLLI